MAQSFPEGFDRALQLAGTALSYMKKKGIPTNPNNFMVWYEFFSGSNLELKEALQPLVQGSEEITDQTSAEIHARFFDAETDADDMRQIGDRMDTVVREMSSALASTHGETKSYGQALDVFNGDLQVANNVSDIKSMVMKIIDDTQGMADRVQQLQHQVRASGDQVAQLSEELERTRQDAMSDGLTGIANRKCFDISLAHAMARAIEEATPLALVMADLDHFKAFNDTHGHPVGDQVLRVVGRTFKEMTKGQDLAARYGGEEFAVILPDTGLQGAVAVAQNLRKAVSSKKLRRRGSDTPLDPLTLSLGLTMYQPGELATSFIDRADRALYSAKRGGRDRVVVSEADDGAMRATG